MKLLVTGGAGFIGSNFIHYWLKNNPGDEIINLDSLTYAGNLDNLLDLADNKSYSFIHGDILDKDLVFSLVPKSDVVVHFAAETHVDRSIKDSAAFIKTNVLGTHLLLEAARINNTRFHHISTDEVFGSLEYDSAPFSETTPYDPRSPYSASKASSDHLVRSYWHTHKLPITISNCSNNYGPYQFPEKLIPLAITNLLTDKKVPVYGQGENVRDWIHVDDHNSGVEAIIKQGKIGETYCLGGKSETKNIDIVKNILQALNKGEEWIEYVTDRPGHDLRYAINIAKIYKELGWEPKINLAEGLAATVSWYQANETWWRKLLDRRAI
ncbi:MAG: dTDP-glucose 4,6-dehydratase [Patescibacteria group bacterium]|nr:dTDP-glucose 4,6-dehydratase [Patescibacteria group bacterium]